jgi:hypothetical protein
MFIPWNTNPITPGQCIFHRGKAHFSGAPKVKKALSSKEYRRPLRLKEGREKVNYWSNRRIDKSKFLEYACSDPLAKVPGSSRNFVIVFLKYQKSSFKIVTIPLGGVWEG